MNALGCILLAIAGTAWADSKTEESLRSQLAAAEAARIVAVRDKAALTAQVSLLLKANSDLTKGIVAVPREPLKTPTEKEAVKNAQSESTVTLANTSASNRAESEFEKQLTATQVDVHDVVTTQRYEMYLLVILTVLVMCFTGVLVYFRPQRKSRETDGAR